MIAMGCGRSGTIGTIGTMFAGYARARARAGYGVAVVLVALTVRKGVFFFSTRRLKTSSLSSLSSLKGIQGIEVKEFCDLQDCKKIVPENRVIVPIVPELF